MKDKRKIDRRFLLYYMRVYDAGTQKQIGNLVDITPRGIMVGSEHPLPEGKTLLIFVVDGTWRLARVLLNNSKNVHALPRLSFSGSYISQFTIKRQPMRHCVSTIEAIYHLCNEAEEAGYEKLDAQHEVLMELLKKLVRRINWMRLLLLAEMTQIQMQLYLLNGLLQTTQEFK